MHRNTKIPEFALNFDSYLQKNESLIIQLCEHIFRSGFVFHDSNKDEIDAGEWVIRDFFDQHIEVFFELVPRDRLNSFFEYLNNFDISVKDLKQKLQQRIIKSFDLLSKGKHHNFNIRKNIVNGLKKDFNHPLHDFLLYIETYYNLILKIEPEQLKFSKKESNLTTKNFNLEDLKKLRTHIQDRLIGRELVKRFLKNIAKKRNISYENLINFEEEKERKYPVISFIVPSEQSLQVNNLKTLNESPKDNEPKGSPDIVHLSIKKDLDSYKKKFFKKNDRPDLGKNLSDSNIANSNRRSANNKSKKEFQKNRIESHSQKNISLRDQIEEHHINENSDLSNSLYNKPLYSDSYDTDVVFGTKKITLESMKNFVIEYPDSALKFIFKKNLDGRPLISEIEEIYFKWEKRGLSKKEIKKYMLEIMKQNEFPDFPMQKLLKILREKIYEISKNDER